MPRNGDKIEVVKVLILAIVSFVLGFGLVIVFLKPSSSSSKDEQAETTETDGKPTLSSGGRYGSSHSLGGGYAPPGGGSSGEEADDNYQGTALPDVPPGKIPEKVAVDGEAFYLKC